MIETLELTNKAVIMRKSTMFILPKKHFFDFLLSSEDDNFG